MTMQPSTASVRRVALKIRPGTTREEAQRMRDAIRRNGLLDDCYTLAELKAAVRDVIEIEDEEERL